MDKRVIDIVKNNKIYDGMISKTQGASELSTFSKESLDSKVEGAAKYIVEKVERIFKQFESENSESEKKPNSVAPIFEMKFIPDIVAVEIRVKTFHSFFPAYFIVCFDQNDRLGSPPPSSLQPETNRMVHTFIAENHFRASLGDKAKGKEIYVMAAHGPLSQIFGVILPIYYSSKSLILSEVYLHVPRDGSFETHLVGALTK